MKKLFLILFATPFIAKAQNTQLNIEGTSGSLYVNHTVTPKQNLYGVGRLYNISPKEIAPFNKFGMDRGLNLGETIKVPLTAANFVDSKKVAADEVALPIYHKVEAKETLYQLSTRYNKIPVATLKQLNKIDGETVSLGQNLIVGYLKIKKVNNTFEDMVTTSTINEEVAVAEPTPPPPSTKPAPKKEKAVTKEPVITPDEPVVVKKEIPVQNPIDEVAGADVDFGKDYKGGVFKPNFKSTGKGETGTAGVFKSTSGWNDGKYYCLHNYAQQGSIVKITNANNGKTIYAKVLDLIPDLKQNDALSVRISNAGAAALGADEKNFSCNIAY